MSKNITLEIGNSIDPANSISVEMDNQPKRLRDIELGDSVVVGPQGPTGPQGPQGPTGPAGEVTLEQLNETISENNLSEREISDNKYARALKKEVSETDFTQVFAENEKIESLQIYGEELTQETREGYNKLPITYESGSIPTHGITATYNKDTGLFKVVGTATEPTWINIFPILKSGTGQGDAGENVDVNGKYLVSNYSKWDSANKIAVMFTDDTNTITQLNDAGLTYMKFNTETINRGWIYIPSTGTELNEEFWLMITDTYENKPYEQYGAMPSLDFPSEVHTMNDRVNLSEIDKVSTTSDGYVNTSTGSCCLVRKGVNYTVSFNSRVTEKNVRLRTLLYPSGTANNDWIEEVVTATALLNTNKFTFTPTQDGYLGFSGGPYLDTMVENIFTNIKLEKGTQASPYSPHGQGSLEVENVKENLANFPTSINGTISGTNFAGVKYEVINKFTSKISGKPTSSEYRVGGVYNSTDVLVPVDYTKNIYISNNLKLNMDMTLVQKDGTYRQVYLKSGDVIPLKETDIGISSLRFEIDTNTEYKNTILRYFIYEEKDEVIIPFPQDTFTGAIGSYKDTIKEVDGRFKIEKRIKEIVLNGSENLALSGSTTDTILVPNFALPKTGIDTVFKSTHFKQNKNVVINSGNIYNKGYNIRFCLDKNIYPDINSFKTKLKELYDAGTPVKVYYILATPDYIDLPDETQEILNGIKLRLGLNNFSIDVGTFEFIYNKSLEKELEEKDALIEELASRILALENATLNLAEGE